MSSLKPKLVVGVTVVVSLLILFSLAQEMNRRWQVQRELQRLEQDVLEAQRKVIELENLNQYFRTDDYQERLAREKLNYRAEGEQVVLIPEQGIEAEIQSSDVSEDGPVLPIPMRWWHIFFVSEAPFELYEEG